MADIKASKVRVNLVLMISLLMGLFCPSPILGQARSVLLNSDTVLGKKGGYPLTNKNGLSTVVTI